MRISTYQAPKVHQSKFAASKRRQEIATSQDLMQNGPSSRKSSLLRLLGIAVLGSLPLAACQKPSSESPGLKSDPTKAGQPMLTPEEEKRKETMKAFLAKYKEVVELLKAKKGNEAVEKLDALTKPNLANPEIISYYYALFNKAENELGKNAPETRKIALLLAQSVTGMRAASPVIPDRIEKIFRERTTFWNRHAEDKPEDATAALSQLDGKFERSMKAMVHQLRSEELVKKALNELSCNEMAILTPGCLKEVMIGLQFGGNSARRQVIEKFLDTKPSSILLQDPQFVPILWQLNKLMEQTLVDEPDLLKESKGHIIELYQIPAIVQEMAQQDPEFMELVRLLTGRVSLVNPLDTLYPASRYKNPEDRQKAFEAGEKWFDEMFKHKYQKANPQPDDIENSI
jgi:hypothetical protein